MKTRKKSVIALLVVLSFLFVVGQSFAINFSDRELDRLQAGKTVKKRLAKSRQNGFYGGSGWAIVEAPVEVVWKAIHDWHSYPDFFPRTVAVKELQRKEKSSLIRMELGYKVLSIKYHVNIVSDPDKKMMSFKLVSNRPSDIEALRGYWRLFPQKNGRTLVGYGVALQLPAGIVAFLGTNLEEMFERHLIGLPEYLKKWVEDPSGNRYRQMTAKK